MFVPLDDENCWRYTIIPKQRLNPRGLGGANLFSVAPFSTPITGKRDGIIPREYTADNDYQMSQEARRNGNFSGVADFVSQDFMVTESMGPIYDRSQEQLGSTDRAITRMRHILLSAAKGLAEGKEPPALAGDFQYGPRRGEDPRAGRGLADPRHRRRPGRPGGLRHRVLTVTVRRGAARRSRRTVTAGRP